MQKQTNDIIKKSHPEGWQERKVTMTNNDIKVTNEYGEEINYDVAVDFMEDELREKLHMELAPCTEQEFFNAYAKAYEEKYGEEWFLTEPNPII